ncbi:P-loop containing nucleoside triphosphate hydrolase protein [Dipodascopsis tothii]|uniref:P-loop containing nucleoside triphosphate hydrolase protein n=1 Tax=Dipodascopsis tothii TaxID=44089 RepID=UPI0034CE0154
MAAHASDAKALRSLDALAAQFWAADPAAAFDPAVVSDVYRTLEHAGFDSALMGRLEYGQYLERFLWPHFSAASADDHAISIALMAVAKSRDGRLDWGLFGNNDGAFAALVHRILELVLQTDTRAPAAPLLLAFVTLAFQALDVEAVRKECAPLVSIGVWTSLHSADARESALASAPHLRKVWRGTSKRFDAALADAGADADRKARLRFDRTWLYSVLLKYVGALAGPADAAALASAERFVELLVALVSQLPTRRYVNTLVKDMHVLVAVERSRLYAAETHVVLRELYALLTHYVRFPIDDFSGVPLTAEEYTDAHYRSLARLQRTALEHFRDKLLVLALTNARALGRREDLLEHLQALSADEVVRFCGLLGLRTSYEAPGPALDRAALSLAIVHTFQHYDTLEQKLEKLPALPTETALAAPALGALDLDGALPLPRFQLQYLSVSDFLYRAYALSRLEVFAAIKADVVAVAQRLRPHQQGFEIAFAGTSRLAQKIGAPAILETAPPKVGQAYPSRVKAEVAIDFDRTADGVLADWDALRPDDVVFLLALAAPNERAAGELERVGIRHVRAATILNVLDHNGASIHRTDKGGKRLNGRQARRRRLHVSIDPVAFQADGDAVYESINCVVRRRPRDANFKPLLDALAELGQTEVALPDWFVDVFLGYGDPASASFENLPNRIERLNMNDTFLDWHHLTASFSAKVVSADGTDVNPPYVLERVTRAVEDTPKKKGRKAKAADVPTETVVQASTFVQPNQGPYPTDARRSNRLAFTPAQVRAIEAGTQPGLTLVVGPPGSGKTDVAAQIVSNIYHNFPDQRTVVVAHTEYALDRLVEKIAALDVDERHLLRLGGRGDSYSRYGRVESLMDRRRGLLAEVSRLAESLGESGAHGDSCETAGYFGSIYVRPRTEAYEAVIETAADVAALAAEFPYAQYFATAPQPLFNPATHSLDEARDIAAGCLRHVGRLFADLAAIRPFELLRTAKDRADYLLVKEARVVVLTAAHAAAQRKHMVELGFRYENVVVEEAAQLGEVESLVPLTLQSTEATGQNPVGRIVLLGDHVQNTPAVARAVFAKGAHMDQSLFGRLLRLGVPATTLDAQGQARPAIADVYSWRYAGLANLPPVEADEFAQANAGLRHELQFVNVDDYNGGGEAEPSPGFFQNLGEAEYVVALYMYMRLLGYPAETITLLAAYAGQRVLIENVLAERCKNNSIFGLPGAVATVAEYQGQQNDYVLVSLVRTAAVGELRDQRRLTAALSRARLGLYVFGRRALFDGCAEAVPFLERLDARRTTDDKLELYVGEMFPSARVLPEEDASKVVVMEGVEHLGTFVYEMTLRKMEQLGRPLPAPVDEPMDDAPVDDEDVDVDDEYGLNDDYVDEFPDPEQIENSEAEYKEYKEYATELNKRYTIR